MIKNMSRLIALATAVMFAGLCFAPIEDRPDGKAFHPELSQRELSKYQTSQVAPNAAPVISDLETRPQKVEPNQKAASVLSEAAKSNDPTAVKSLTQSAVDQGAPRRSAGINLMLAGILVLVGLVAAFGIRRYLDQSVPAMNFVSGKKTVKKKDEPFRFENPK
jgi:hypothetical protein